MKYARGEHLQRVVPPSASSAQAPVETAWPVSSLGVGGGSNPASVGVLDMLEWKWRSIAAQHRNDAGKHTTDYHRIRLESAAEALEACALELRLLTGATTERQPDSNAGGEPPEGRCAP